MLPFFSLIYRVRVTGLEHLRGLDGPVLFTDPSVPGAAPAWHAAFGEWPAWWPDFLPSSPAFFILAFISLGLA